MFSVDPLSLDTRVVHPQTVPNLPVVRRSPLVVPTDQFGTVNNSYDINVNVLGAGTFYNLPTPITGQNAIVANIEGGHVDGTHEGLSVVQTITGTGAVGDVSAHATAAAHAIAWAPGSTSAYRGVAFGATLWSGAISTSANAGGNGFSVSYNSQLSTYRTAMIDGVGGSTANVINSSWGNSAGNLDQTGSGQGDFSRMIDALAFTSGKVVVFAAGNSGASGSNTVSAPAAGYNVISVGALTFGTSGPAYNTVASFSSRGPSDFFKPSVAQPTDTSDPLQGTLTPYTASQRIRVDITAPGDQLYLANTNSSTSYSQNQGTSFAAPMVAGGATLLVSYANTNGLPTQAVDGRVIKSVLLNSADKTAGWNNGQSYSSGTWATTQSLDANVGAGRMNLDQAFAQYAGVGVAQNSTGLTGGTVAATGWGYGRVGTSSQNDYFLSTSLRAGTELNTTLSWFANRYINLGNSAVGGVQATDTAEVALADLNLQVWRVTGPGGSLIGASPVATSSSPYNIVEHLSFLVPNDGYYMIRVANAGNLWDFGTPGGSSTTPNTDYGLAWMSRASLQSVNLSGTAGAGSYGNGLVAGNGLPGPNLTLTISASGSELRFFSSLYIGGDDRGATKPANVAVAASTTLTAYNTVRLYGDPRYPTSDSRYSASSLTVSGTGQFGDVTADAGASITAASGGTIGVNKINTTGGTVTIGGGGTFNIQGGIGGTGGITKVGAGTVTLTGASSYIGATVVGGGTASTSDTSTLLLNTTAATLGSTSSLTVNNNSLLNLNNRFLGYNGDRVPNSAPVFLNGGRIAYDSRPSSGVANTETMGNVTITGHNVITLTPAGSGAAAGTTTELNFGNLTQGSSDKGTLFFRTSGAAAIGGTPGTTNVNVRFSSGMTIVGANGTVAGMDVGIVPFAAANITNTNVADPRGLVTYDSTTGVKALNAKDSAFFQATATLAAGLNNNFDPTATVSPGTMSIGTSPIAINSLVADGTYFQPIMTGSATLTVSSGAVATFFGMRFNGPTVDFGANTGYFHVGGGDVQITSTSSITGSGGVVVSSLDTSGNGLVFSNSIANTFTGGLYINGNARVDFTTNNQLGGIGSSSAAPEGITFGGGTLRYTGTTNLVSLNGTSGNRPIRLGPAGGSFQSTNSNSNANLTVAGQITGPGDLNFLGLGTLTLSNNTNNYQGNTNIQAGSISVLQSNVLPTTTLLVFGTPNSATGGRLVLQSNASQTVAGLAIAAGNTAGSNNVITTSTATATATLTVSGSSDSFFNGMINGTKLALTKSGTGSLTLGGTNGYGGATQVTGGTLLVNGSIASATSVTSAAIGGSGSINAALTLSAGSILTPGAAQSIGTLNVSSIVLSGAARYTWEVNAIPTMGTQGANWDFLNVTGSASGTPFEINIVAAGDVSGFNSQVNYTWKIATFGNVGSLSSTSFSTINTGWTGPNALNGSFAAALSGNDLMVTYTSAVPEPPYALLACSAVGLACWFVRRRALRFAEATRA